jgi:hypothetical protein
MLLEELVVLKFKKMEHQLEPLELLILEIMSVFLLLQVLLLFLEQVQYLLQQLLMHLRELQILMLELLLLPD